MTLALVLLAAFILACWCLVRAGARGVPESEQLRRKRALEDVSKTLFPEKKL